QHGFDLKQRWRVSASAIVRRAYQLRLLSAIGYRQANRNMSAKGWIKQEPYEPEFVGPELLPTAFKAIEDGLGITAASVCEALHLTPKTFSELTGIKVQQAARPNIVAFKPTA